MLLNKQVDKKITTNKTNTPKEGLASRLTKIYFLKSTVFRKYYFISNINIGK